MPSHPVEWIQLIGAIVAAVLFLIAIRPAVLWYFRIR